MSLLLFNEPSSQQFEEKGHKGNAQTDENDKECTFDVLEPELHQLAPAMPALVGLLHHGLRAGALAILLPLGKQARLGNRTNLVVDCRQQVMKLPEHHRCGINDDVIRYGEAEEVLVLVKLKWVAQRVGA